MRVLLLGLLCCGVLSAAEPSAQLDTALNTALAHVADHQLAAGTFEQTSQRLVDVHDGDPQIERHTGTFYIKRPDLYDVTYRKPNDEEWMLRLISDGSTEWTVEQLFSDQDPDVTNRPVSGDSGMGAQFARLMTFQRAAIEEDFTLTVSLNEAGQLVAQLTPRSPDLADRMAAIAVTLNNEGVVQSVVLDDAQGNRVTMTVTSCEFDGEVPAGVFTWTKP